MSSPGTSTPVTRPTQSRDGSPRSVLIPRVCPVFRAVTTTVIPIRGELDETSWFRIEELVEAALADRSPSEKRQLRLFLYAIEWLPVARYGRRFTSLTAGQRQRFLDWLQEHAVQIVRSGFWGLRTLAFLGYYGRSEAARAIGYTPDARGWEVRR